VEHHRRWNGHHPVPGCTQTPREFEPISERAKCAVETTHAFQRAPAQEHASGPHAKNVEAVVELTLVTLARICFGYAPRTTSCANTYLEKFLRIIPSTLLRPEGTERPRGLTYTSEFFEARLIRRRISVENPDPA